MPSRKSRHPKPGTGFLLIRLIGWFLKIIGLLLMLAALVGCLAMLPKIIPVITDAWQYLPEDKMAGLVFFGSLSWLLVFGLLGLVGAIMAGIGFAFGRWGTEPAIPSTVQSSPTSTSAWPTRPG